MGNGSPYYERLLKSVLEASEASAWQGAVLEWDVVDCIEDEYLDASCICGKENLRYLYTIRNRLNGNELYPIGSKCIKKFMRSDLDDYTSIMEQLFRLLHAIENREYITLTSDYFSRKLLAYLYEEGAFRPTSYNMYRPVMDYDFMLKMFNKHGPDSSAQDRKINAIILNSIKPFLQRMLHDKIRRKR